MSKKYIIVNSNSSNSSNSSNLLSSNDLIEEHVLTNLLYIIIIIVIIYLCWYTLNFFYNSQENYSLVQTLQEKNKELNFIKDSLNKKIQAQTQAIHIANNYNKVDPSSYNDQLQFILTDVSNTKLPEMDLESKQLIKSKLDLDTTLIKAENMKNYYKPGEIITSNSTFEITPNDICYKFNGKNSEIMKKYPSCMVCQISSLPSSKLKDSIEWKDTRTNISKVCLFDPNANPNSGLTGIPNLAQCKEFCSIKSESI